MKTSLPITSFLIFSIFLSCKESRENKAVNTIQQIDTIYQKDSTLLKETTELELLNEDEYLSSDIKPIKENFNRINTKKNWDSIINKDLWLSTEGGYVKFYYDSSLMQKAVVRYYGEMGQRLTEYYFLGKELSFVFEKLYNYNAPMYLESEFVVKQGNTVFFNIDSSIIEENRFYFRNKELIRIVSNQDCGAPFAQEFRTSEQQRIEAEIEEILGWKKSKEQEINRASK